MDDNNEQMDAPSAPVKRRHRRSASLSLSALLHGHLHRRHDPGEPPSPEPSPKVSPSKWIRFKQHHNDHHTAAPENKEKCRSLISRMGRHRRHASDLTYDPLSYAHNFESDDVAGDDEDSVLRNNFTARLRAGEKSVELKEVAVAEDKEGKKVIMRRKSFDLNELMAVTKCLEDAQNGGANKDREKTMTRSVTGL